jgi:parvulin-like peptidyl-prolyl isomerase
MNPGDISEPVLTQFGYHVVKVEDKRPNKNYRPGNYESQVMNIKRSLYQTKHVEGSKMWDEHVEKLKTDKSFKVDEENIQKAMGVFKTKIDSGMFKPENFSDDEKSIVLASWNDGNVTTNDLFLMFGPQLSREVNRFKNKNQFKQSVDMISMQAIITAEAEKNGYDEEKEIHEQLESFKNQRMLSLLNKKEVNDKVTVEDDELEKYYQEHTNEFLKPAELLIWEIYLEDESVAKRVLAKAKAGQNFEKLAEKYSKDNFYQKKKGKLGYKRQNSRGVVSKKAFEIGPNKIEGPIKYKKGWVIIKTGDKKPEEIQSYEKVQARVKSKVKARKIKDRKEEWEEELKNRYAVKINEELVENI